jgi:Arc/MetJ-type ribon-helix-helix transcriptional regulator
MSPTTHTTTVRIDDALLDGLQQLKERDGVPISEQVRRAIQAWLEQKGIKPRKTANRRAVTRRKA